MQWSGKAYAGFSNSQPWIKLNPNYPQINVEKSIEEKDSILYFYRKLIAFKNTSMTAIYGDYEEKYYEHTQIFAYLRTFESVSYLVLCNMTGQKAEIDLEAYEKHEVLFSNIEQPYSLSALEPFEARVYQV